MFKLTIPNSLILASGSPRRSEMLRGCGLDFKIEVSHLNEDVHPAESAQQMVERLALAKAQLIASRNPSCWVIGADTTVLIDNQILGKPADKQEAIAILGKIQGRVHEVWSAFSLVQEPERTAEPDASAQVSVVEVHRSLVELMPLSPLAIRAYVESGEPMDKAGAYAVQDLGAHFIKRIDGSYTNVVGLNLAAVMRRLLEFGVVEYSQ